MSLTRRTQILLDEERHELLRRTSAETGESVGALIRRAIDEAYADRRSREQAATQRRTQALHDFLAAPPLAVGEWTDVEAELATDLDRHPAG